MIGAQPNKFQYKFNIRGVETDILPNAPQNWLDTNITYTRSKTYGGLFRALSLPMKFVTQGAYLLRKEFYKYGILSYVRVAVNMLNNNWGYNNIYNGRIDFSTVSDEIATLTANSISDDFSVQLNANDGVDYAIPLDVDEAISLELTPLDLNEQADIIFLGNTDHRSNAFFQIQIVNNQQNSVNPSVYDYAETFQAVTNPDWSTDGHYFFIARTTCNIAFTFTAQGNIRTFLGGANYQIQIVNQNGTVVKMLYSFTGTNTDFNINTTFYVNVSQGDRLFLYFFNSSGNTNDGFQINSGTINLKYKTSSPASMCKALPAMYVFQQLLQAMNTNQDSGPNQPVACKSGLLTGLLSDLVITCSDSIKLATGSLVYAGESVFPGTYKVIYGSILYGGFTYNENDIFPYNYNALNFTGDGVAERITSGFVGQVYNPGDTLQAGGIYLVGGDPGTSATYNAIIYPVGTFFPYVLGQNQFTGSDDSVFVEQTSVAPQLIISFKDFFQSIYSVMGGNCAFGIEQVSNPDPIGRITQTTINQCFIEDLSYVYRGTIGNVNAGIVDSTIKIEPATDLICNSINVGYRDQQYSQLNGFSEVNSTQTYTSSIVTPQKVLNLVSVIRADPYGIEEVRISQNDTAASRSDNDNFFVWKKPSPENDTPLGDIGYCYHPLRAEGLMTNPNTGKPMISGVDASYYNWKISPKQNLMRGGAYLASIFYNMKGYKLTISAAPKNTAMVTVDINGNRVAEADPLQISSLPKALFAPWYATFKPGLNTNTFYMMDSIPYAFLRFTFNGKNFKMFADTMTINIGQNSEQELKGLLTPDSDLTQLIR